MRKESIQIGDICVFRYSFEMMDSRMYMIREKDEILVIDPCEEETLLQDAAGARKALVLLTHEHYDHISGVNWLKTHFSCLVCSGSICAGRVRSIEDNHSDKFAFLFLLDREKYDYVRRNLTLPYVCEADECISGAGSIRWGTHTIELCEVGGHSPGSCLIMFDQKLLFTGDNLLGNGQELKSIDADKEGYAETVLPFLRHLNREVYVLPGHGEGNTLPYFLSKIL